MSALSQEMIVTAIDLLTEFGELATFSAVTGSYFDIEAQTNVSTTVSYTGFVAPGDYKASEIDGHFIQSGDVKILAGVMVGTPNVGDTVAFNNLEYRIMSVKKTRMSGDTVIYTIQGRV